MTCMPYHLIAVLHSKYLRIFEALSAGMLVHKGFSPILGESPISTRIGLFLL